MQKKLLVLLVAVLALLNVYQFSNGPKGKPVLVSGQQLACLNNWRPPLEVLEVFGPKPLQGMKVAYLDTEKYSGGFDYEFSSCFFDSHSEKVHVNKIPERYQFYKATGGKDIYFYKRPGEEYVVIYVNKAG